MKSIIVVHKSIIFQTGNNHGFPFVLFVYQRDPRFIPVQSSFSTSRARTQRWNRVVSFYTLLRKTRHDFPWCHVRDCFILFRIRLNMFKLYIFHSSLTQSHFHWGGGAQMSGASPGPFEATLAQLPGSACFGGSHGKDDREAYEALLRHHPMDPNTYWWYPKLYPKTFPKKVLGSIGRDTHVYVYIYIYQNSIVNIGIIFVYVHTFHSYSINSL